MRELMRPVCRVKTTAADRLQKRAALEWYRSQIRWEDTGRTPYPLSGALVADFIEHDELFFP